MKSPLFLQRAVAWTLGILSGFAANAQITTDSSPSNEELVQLLVGPDVQISNVGFSGDILQRGSFENNDGNLTISSGIVLSSGNIEELTGPNDEGGATGPITGVGENDDLTALAEINTNDAAVLQFDFVATGDSLYFNYSFGSEEYNEFVCASFNDVFGLFLSGPGINGDFSENAINLAIVPDSDQIPISIHTVNNGQVGTAFGATASTCENLDPNWVENAQYYVDNAENYNNPYDPTNSNPNADPNATQMDGFTVTLTAGAALQCGETYTLRFAIADGSDSSYDSVVLLEAGSFSAGSVNLNADAVPIQADGLQDIVPYEEASEFLPDVFSYPTGESFPYDAWNADNNIPIQLDGQSLVVDAVVIEGCNDAQFTVIRPELGSDVQDTLYLDLAGSALLGDDFSDTFNEVVMAPNQTERSITLGVKDDGVEEGVEFVEISFEYVNGCGETIVTSSRVAILDPIPVVATPSPLGCLQPDGQQLLGYDEITGYGPFNFIWDGVEWNNAEWGSDAWVTSIDSLFDMTNDNGDLVPSHNIELTVIDQCGKEHVFEQLVLHPVMLDADICFEDLLDYPMFNPSIPVEDVTYQGVSVFANSNPLGDNLTINASEEGDLWRLNSISSGLNGWTGTLTIVDTCGYETSGTIVVEDCDVVNVISPNGDNKNDKFQIRGLNGMMGSRLVVFNRYGSVVWEGETQSDEEYELVWNGRHANGNFVAAGTYQWVLTKADGNGTVERGQLTVFSGDY